MESWKTVAIFVVLAIISVDAWQNNFDAAHSFNCPSGKTVLQIQSIHTNSKEDRRWNWTCKTENVVSDSCWMTPFVNDWDGTLNWQCPGDHLLTGTYSVHNNGREDRRFKYRCCRLRAGCVKSGCSLSDQLNDHDSRMNYYVQPGKELNGFWSSHHNHFEDRVWKAYQCNVVCNGEATSGK